MRFLNKVFGFFFPSICTCCKEPLVRGEKMICLDCLFHLSISPKDNACFDFKRDERIRTIVHQFKYKRNRPLAFYAGKLMAHRLARSGALKGVDALIPVPISTKKERKRGYNQTYWLAKGIHEVLGVPVENRVLLRRNEWLGEISQASRTHEERRKTSSDVFYIKNAHLLENKCVLVVDDVITSGTTMNNCCTVLAQIPHIRVKKMAFSSA